MHKTSGAYLYTCGGSAARPSTTWLFTAVVWYEAVQMYKRLQGSHALHSVHSCCQCVPVRVSFSDRKYKAAIADRTQSVGVAVGQKCRRRTTSCDWDITSYNWSRPERRRLRPEAFASIERNRSTRIKHSQVTSTVHAPLIFTSMYTAVHVQLPPLIRLYVREAVDALNIWTRLLFHRVTAERAAAAAADDDDVISGLHRRWQMQGRRRRKFCVWLQNRPHCVVFSPSRTNSPPFIGGFVCRSAYVVAICSHPSSNLATFIVLTYPWQDEIFCLLLIFLLSVQ